ncbi:hypothetical protein [Mycobacterium sp. 1164966.3]|uniref:hypothetical protein n=1 Tax=Mycobacterium sp. 1164966.3 TaxID=1856861 RepID=UPI0012E76959|nr:hypothetical protein [Mycobacterium sp. 1164966.3]
MVVLVLVALLVTLGVAVAGWFRPAPSNKPSAAQTYTDQQIAMARTKVCAAYDKVHHAVLANTGRDGDNDPGTVLGVAANARIALYDGGNYLLKVLAEESATPGALAEAIRALSSAYQQLAINYMAEAPDPELKSSRDVVEAAGSKVSEMCK